MVADSPGAICVVTLALDAEDQSLVQLEPLNRGSSVPVMKGLHLRRRDVRGARRGWREAERIQERIVDRALRRRCRRRKIVGHRRDAGVVATEYILAVGGGVGVGDQRLERGGSGVLQGRGGGVRASGHRGQRLDGALGGGADRIERGLRRLEIGDRELVGGGERLQHVGLIAQRQLVAGLVAELQAEIGVLAAARLGGQLGKLILRLRHAGEHRRAEGIGGDDRGHGLHTALSSDENIALTVVSSLAVVV